MDKGLRLRAIVCLAVTVLSLWFLAPTVWDLYHPDGDTTKRPAWMPGTAMRLGLDLQGGVHMVLGVDLDKVVVDQLSSYGKSLEKMAADKGIKDVKTKVLPGSFELEVKAANLQDKERVADFITNDFTALSIVGEMDQVIVTRIQRAQEDFVRSGALNQSIETIRNRIDEFGVSEPILSKKGTSQILVQFPGAKEPERLKSLIGQTAQLTFQMVPEVRSPNDLANLQQDWTQKIAEAEKTGAYTRKTFARLSEYRQRLNTDLAGKLPADTEIVFMKNQDLNIKDETLVPYLLSTKNKLSGEYIESAAVQMDRDSMTGLERPVVSFSMNASGTPLFGDLTREFQGHYMAIVLDGVVKSAPVIETPITGGSGRITLGRGGMEESQKEASDLAIVLRAGALPAQIEVQEERVIGPSMGKDALELGKRALGITSVLVFLFIWAYYGSIGLIANFVTFVNVCCIFAFLGLMGATLTLPGIAGIVLTLGMALDALIIIFERMREERRLGRSPAQVLELGFDKAFSSILDSNVTTAIGGFVLLQYGTGSIRGFALTLIVGIIINVFMATYFARAIMTLVMAYQGKKSLKLGLSNRELSEIHSHK